MRDSMEKRYLSYGAGLWIIIIEQKPHLGEIRNWQSFDDKFLDRFTKCRSYGPSFPV